MIHYLESADTITPNQLAGFFDGWPRPPTPQTHLHILRSSDEVALALTDTPEPRVVGFATAITDGVLAAYIPLLEVLPDHRGRGIGSELVRRLLVRLDGLYMIDALCDQDVLPFYTSLGMEPATGASIRVYAHQSGSAREP